MREDEANRADDGDRQFVVEMLFCSCATDPEVLTLRYLLMGSCLARTVKVKGTTLVQGAPMTSTAPWALRTHTPFRPWRFTKHTLAAVSVSVLALSLIHI